MVSYLVEYYQINIGVGDCEIVLLIEVGTGGDSTIKHAALVDGGQDGGRITGVLQTMRRIEQRFGLRPNELQFDTIIISHWDSDHYTGVLKMISNDLDTQYTREQQSGSAGSGPYRVTFLKYNSDGEPLSTLYTPYREDSSLNIPGKLNVVYNASRGEFGMTGGRRDRICKWISDMTAANETILNGAPQAITASDTTTLIGRELWSGEFAVAAKTATSPAALLAAYTGGTNFKVDRPGLFCIAANNRHLPGVHANKLPNHSYKNRSSIACLVIKPDGSISHYFCGDAEADLEAAVILWTGLRPADPAKRNVAPTLQESIPIVKASHHGSPTSFPLFLCQHFKPSYFLFSAGTKYGHPSWNTLFYVYSYLVSWRGIHAWKKSDEIYQRPVYLTCFPYYFNVPDADLIKNILSSVNPLLGTGPYDTTWQTVISSFFDGTDRTHDLVHQFRTEKITTLAGQAPWIRDKLLQVILPQFCFLDDTALPANENKSKGTKRPGKSYLPYNPKAQVLYAMITSGDALSARVVFWGPQEITSAPATAAQIKAADEDPEPPSKKTKDDGSGGSNGGGSGDGGDMSGGGDTSGGDTTGGDPSMPIEPTHPPTTLTVARVSGNDGNVQAARHLPTPDVVPALPANPTAPPRRYYVLSSLVEFQDATRSAYVTAEWDAFVSTLSSGFITLASSPSSSPSSVQLDLCDEWLAWFTTALSPSTTYSNVTVSVTASLQNSLVAIDHFDVVVPFPFSSGSSRDLTLSFGPSRKIGPSTDPSTFDLSEDFLRFDMANESSTDISLVDLLSFCGLPMNTVGFGSELTFHLDKANSVVWFSPVAGNYSASFRLQADIQPGDWSKTTEELKKIGLWDVTPDSITVVAKRRMSKLFHSDGNLCEKAPQLGFGFEFSEFTATLFCSPQTFTGNLRFKTGALAAVKDLLRKVGDGSVVATFEGVLSEITKVIDILQVSVEVERTDTGYKIAMLSVDAQVTLNMGQSSTDSKEVVFFLTFGWPNMLFRGSLFTPEADQGDWRKLMPYFEELVEIIPTVDQSKIRSSVSVLDLIPGIHITAMPQGVPSEITEAFLEVDDTTISFAGTMEPYQPQDAAVPAAVQPLSFDTLDVALSYSRKSNTFSFSVDAMITLHPSVNPNDEPGPTSNDAAGTFAVSLDYQPGAWTLTGMLTDINFGDLLIFFHPEERSRVQDVLGQITIQSLDVTYQYLTNGMPGTFQVDGVITIADLEMKMQLVHDGTGWLMRAALGASKECALSDVVASICGGDAQSFQMPDFVGNIQLGFSQQSGDLGNWDDSPVFLSCVQQKDPMSPLVLTVQITLGKLQLTFVQFNYAKTSGGAAMSPKRLLMFSFTQVLPSLQVPVVGTLDNPVDGIQFVWVHDSNATGGITKAEVDEVNNATASNDLGYKNSKKITKDSDVVIIAGCHFMLLAHDGSTSKVALDYKFAPKQTGPANSPTNAPTDHPSSSADTQPDDQTVGGVSKAAVHKVVGPLSLTNIGLQYKDSKLFITFDATLALGPISFSMIGFGIGFTPTPHLFTHFDISDFSLQLQGLAAGLNKPPMLIAGMFEDLSTPTMELFAGGVAVSIKAYSFLAVGSYGVVEDTGHQEYKTVFVFAQLHGPLVELEFATLNGVTLGFGYNSYLKLPNVDEVLDFPLVKGISVESADNARQSSNVLAVLSDGVFDTWVHPQNDSLWFAAGLEALAFKTLDVRAVAVIEVEPDVSLGLFADAVCSLPPSQPAENCFIYVELGITCRVDIKNGTFAVEGKLSPNSFVLHQSCHLLGGFAMYYWFDPSPYAGDFVFTVGGYHPAYRPPTYYPQPQRLTITWQLDSHIGITGEAYFAVTPKICMGGGSLSVVFSAGPISAWFDSNSDFMMVWDPFHFSADVGVDVGVSFSATILFVSVNITVDIGADLHLEGPPLGGNVHINFYLFGFDIYFGSPPGPPPPLTLDEFWDLLARSSNQQGAGKDIGVTPVVQGGYAPGQDKDVTPIPGIPWRVVGGQFSFVIQCRFALKNVQFMKEKGWTDVVTGNVPVYSKAMHSTQEIESTLKVTIMKRETSEIEDRFNFAPITKNVPSAQWGQYVEGEDPSTGSMADTLYDGSGSTLNGTLMGVAIAAPIPLYPDDRIPPYNAHDAMYIDVITGESFPTGVASSDADAWLPKPTDWDGAALAWSSPSSNLQATVDSWAAAFKWHDKLKGVAPPFLLENFSEACLSVPAVTNR